MEERFKVYIKGVQGRENDVVEVLTDLAVEEFKKLLKGDYNRPIGVASPTDFNDRKLLLKSVVHFKPDAVYNRELRQHTVRAPKNVTYAEVSKLASRKEMEERRKEK